MDQVALVTGAVFILGLAVGMGKLMARVDHLEDWRRDFHEDMKAIRTAVEELARQVTAAPPGVWRDRR